MTAATVCMFRTQQEICGKQCKAAPDGGGLTAKNTLPERRAPLHDYPVYNPAHMPRERLFGAGGGGWGRNKVRPPS